MKYLYTVYVWLTGGLYFLILTLISIPVLLIVPTKKYIGVFRFFLRIMFALLFIRVKREFDEKIDLSKNYLYIPNHVSLLDAPICSAYMPEFITAIEAKEHFSWPLYGKLATLYGNIPIDRKSVQNSIKSLQQAKAVLQESNSMVVFPEGSRTDDGSIGRFKKMPFQLAKDAMVGIVPVGMSGVYRLNPKNSIFFKPSVLKLKFGKPISAKKVAEMDIDELVEFVHNQVVELHKYN